jgi:hypothetical protein
VAGHRDAALIETAWRLRRVALDAYRKDIAPNPRRQRMFIGSVSFFAGFLGARVVTHAIRAGVGPFRNLSVGGRHLHHMVFGIGGLLSVGYLWLLLVGTESRASPASRSTAAAFGLASALTLDEFALWLDLQDVYWAKQGRRSVDAAVLFGSVLSVGLWGRPLFLALGRELSRVRHSRWV